MEGHDNSRNTKLGVKQKDEHDKEKMKKNADRRAQAQVSDLKIGETVLIKGRKIYSVRDLTRHLSK